MILWISANPLLRSSLGSNGNTPVRSSYSITPNEYTSVLVSISEPDISACSGLMYSGVPIIWPRSVKTVFSVSLWLSALAMPKSITLIPMPSTPDGFLSPLGVCPDS